MPSGVQAAIVQKVYHRAAPLLPHRQLPTRPRRGKRFAVDFSKRAPLVRNAFGGPFYCKTIWPGGGMGLVNGQPPGPPGVWVRSTPGKPHAGCYPNNLTAVPDLVSNGTYGSGFRFGADGSALTEAARQHVATMERLEAAGRITPERLAAEIDAAIASSQRDPNVAARGWSLDPAKVAQRPTTRETGKGGVRTITDAELRDICGAKEGDRIYCNTRWYYGLVDMKGVPEDIVKRDHPHLLPWKGREHETCPPGVSWWLRAGAWIVRESYEGLNEAGEQVKRVTRLATRAVQYNLNDALPGAGDLVAAAVLPAEQPALQGWCKTIWPGGYLELPVGQAPPGTWWRKVGSYAESRIPPCFPGV